MKMNKIMGFFATASQPTEASHQAARNTLERLARFSRMPLGEGRIGDITLYLIGNEIPVVPSQADAPFDFMLCPNDAINPEWDRYLKVRVSPDGVHVENDYAATIPVYYSTEKHLSVSNLASCVEQDLAVKMDDISPDAMFGFLRFSHFIWDETAFSTVRQLIPDAKADFFLTLENSIVPKHSVKASSSRCNRTDNQVADELYELNRELVMRTLGDAETVILPLSAGYDSRMIFSVLASDKQTKKRLHCFTYGDPGCVEVEAARMLCEREGVAWQRISLPCHFLSRPYLDVIHDIFGASLHMHGMYQLEFFEQLERVMPKMEGAVLTSGFMTGVPAGQHNRLLGISAPTDSLYQAMENFSQSRVWPNEMLKELPLFRGNDYSECAEARFRNAFDSAPGEIFHKSIIFDIWTRQRNFISYYPRTLEWCVPTISPHMNTDYVNFFLSLEKPHLDDRKAVELMFTKHYPEHGAIVSNSNGIKTLSRGFDAFLYAVAAKLQRLRLTRLLPRKYWITGLWLDIPALQNSGPDGLYPLLSEDAGIDEIIDGICGRSVTNEQGQRALRGDVAAYERLIPIQSVLLSLMKTQKL